ncbi:MAG TPA: NADH-quinone oxidoreductase subunit H, partial [Candidatus Paceibacterota bacterium]
MITSILIILLQGGLLILGAPLVRGLIRTLKARLQNRKGPPLFQSYFDLIKLFQKESVASHNSSFIFQIAPWIIFGATASSA